MSNASSYTGSPENMTHVGALHAVTFRYECIGLLTDHMNWMTPKFFSNTFFLLEMKRDINVPWQKI